MSAENTQPKRLAYTATQLAAQLNVSSRTLRRLELRGLLKPSKALSKKLYPHTEVERFLRETL